MLDESENHLIFDDGNDVYLKFYGAGPMDLTPGQKLLKAMLELAIQDAANPTRVGGHNPTKFFLDIKRTAVAYIEADDDEYPLSFNSCCEGLGLNPQAVRRQIRRTLNGGQEVKFTDMSRKPRRYVRHRAKVDSMMELGFTHEYVSQNCCKDCRYRYHVAYNSRRPTPRRERDCTWRATRKDKGAIKGRPAEGETAA